MNITKQIIIDKAESSQGESPYMYNLRYTIGQYIMSIAVGEGNYCSPRALLDDVSEYTAVEVGIIDTKKPKPDGSQLMSLSQVENNFGDEVARLCEGYGWTGTNEDLRRNCTVLPWVCWLDVEVVANRIRTTVEAARKRNEWNEVECQPF